MLLHCCEQACEPSLWPMLQHHSTTIPAFHNQFHAQYWLMWLIGFWIHWVELHQRTDRFKLVVPCRLKDSGHIHDKHGYGVVSCIIRVQGVQTMAHKNRSISFQHCSAKAIAIWVERVQQQDILCLQTESFCNLDHAAQARNCIAFVVQQLVAKFSRAPPAVDCHVYYLATIPVNFGL